MKPIVQEITKHQLKNNLPVFKVGDGVRVHTKVREGEKERIQVFAGIVIARKGHGIHESFTVRRISYGEGVEKVFPVNSPNIDKIDVERDSEVMRSRLYYLRDRVGKKAVQVKERRLFEAASARVAPPPAAPAPEAAAPATA